MLIDMKSRADLPVDATREASSTLSVPRLQVFARLRINLRRCATRMSGWTDADADAEATRLLKDLIHAPAGAEVVIEVREGQQWPGSGIWALREQGTHLGRITIECDDPRTALSWVAALRGESGLR